MSNKATTVAATTPKLDVDKTRERLSQLNLMHAAEVLPDQLSAAVKKPAAPHQFLDELLDIELTAREERRVRTSLRLSGLPTGQTLANFDFAFQPSIERSRIETLATCAWIRANETLLIQGPPGVGKTHLAVARRALGRGEPGGRRGARYAPVGVGWWRFGRISPGARCLNSPARYPDEIERLAPVPFRSPG